MRLVGLLCAGVLALAASASAQVPAPGPTIVHAGTLLGLSDLVGSLEPGKQADLIAVDGDPLTDVTVLEKVGFVIKGGRVYKGAA